MSRSRSESRLASASPNVNSVSKPVRIAGDSGKTPHKKIAELAPDCGEMHFFDFHCFAGVGKKIENQTLPPITMLQSSGFKYILLLLLTRIRSNSGKPKIFLLAPLITCFLFYVLGV